ncbi:hypothetical protein [Sphingomonas sp. PAMC 26621]|uniref:hypothetical protein n=1 Tax=Sphingomonas sp. PAMC 26621 TaxID=1112213 RepID=UPI001478804D|nr:hypothetical protein [Sphingomonas sp. PAMC 26621]
MRASSALPIAARGTASADQAGAVLKAGLALAGHADWDGLARGADAALQVEIGDLGSLVELVSHYTAPWIRRFIRSTRETGTLRTSLIGMKPKHSPPVMMIRDIGSTAAGRSFSPVEATFVATTLMVFGIVVTPCRSPRR